MYTSSAVSLFVVGEMYDLRSLQSFFPILFLSNNTSFGFISLTYSLVMVGLARISSGLKYIQELS